MAQCRCHRHRRNNAFIVPPSPSACRYHRTGTLVRWPNTTANQRTTKRRRVRKRQKKRKRESLELALLESSETRLVGQLDAAKSPWSGVGANDVDDLPIGFESTPTKRYRCNAIRRPSSDEGNAILVCIGWGAGAVGILFAGARHILFWGICVVYGLVQNVMMLLVVI